MNKTIPILTLLLFAAAALNGCSSATVVPAAATEISAPQAATETSAPAVPTNTPSAPALAAGLRSRTITVDEMERTYYLYVPSGFDPGQPASVVMVFHGLSQEGSYMVPTTGFNKIADSAGFLVVYPNGFDPGGLLSWNAGACCGYAVQNNVDEPAFVRGILSDLEKSAAIDRKRIFVSGFSNGAALTYRLACEMSDTFAAAAPVAGNLFLEDCRPTQPVSIIHIHGKADFSVPLDGGTVGTLLVAPVRETVSDWARFDGCADEPQTEQTGKVVRTSYVSCRDGTGVELYVLEDMGHKWPAELIWPATQTIWEFFKNHPKL